MLSTERRDDSLYGRLGYDVLASDVDNVPYKLCATCLCMGDGIGKDKGFTVPFRDGRAVSGRVSGSCAIKGSARSLF